MKKVLFLASNKNDVRALQELSRGVWYLVCPEKPTSIISLCETAEWDVVLIDIDISGVFILDLLQKMKKIPGHPVYYVLSHTPFFQMEDFYKWYGASGFLPLPEDMQLLFFQIENLFFKANNVVDNNLIASTHLLGFSQVMCNMRILIDKYAKSIEPVLILGETGCGKELVARALHFCSKAKDGPFCAQNVSCIPHPIAEALLFGSTKGCFTDARDSPGMFEKAHNGTLFLDEIGTIDYDIQTKLLRIIEEKEVCRLGCTRQRPVKFRLVCATNANLAESVDKGLFRSDLFYRLDVLRIIIPPLRERKEDIPVLANYFLKSFDKKISSSCFENLKDHPWPGNVRQLFQCLKRAAADCNSPVIYPEHIAF